MENGKWGRFSFLCWSPIESYNSKLLCILPLSKDVCDSTAVFHGIITLLRNASMKSLEFRSELARVREQNIDITNFENDLEKFKEAFGRKLRTCFNFDGGRDKSIDQLQKTKDALIYCLRLANDKQWCNHEMTHKNPTMKAKFDKLDLGFVLLLIDLITKHSLYLTL